MINFESDYNVGCHPKILEKIINTNNERLSGYGNDKYCESAKEKIRKACNNYNADIYFTVGGTQTNQIVISSLLNLYEGVISAQTGHVNVHEAGTIEHNGHKVLTVPTKDGKIIISELKKYLTTFYSDNVFNADSIHVVHPGMIYITYPTEYGTLYTKSELEELSNISKQYGLPLYLDGARLGYGIMSDQTDVTLEDINKYFDVFYIGGTKIGALFGEAIVFTHGNAPKNFSTTIKQSGALLAKGRLLGIQFDTLFENNLYFNISKNAIVTAEKLKKILKDKNYKFFIESPTNQQFVILENNEIERLKKYVKFCFWEKYDDNHSVVRFTTSWATTDEELEKLKNIL